MSIVKSVKRYEEWLRTQLGDEVVEHDLHKKREEMAAASFPFLRATFWRWAETIPRLCGNLADAPVVLAVGDIHLENFGTWRDADGRLVWGVNDFDEAAEMPYPFDLIRLATSALIAAIDCDESKPDRVARMLLQGYRAGLDQPVPSILDGSQGSERAGDSWLRSQADVPDTERKQFWDGLEKKFRKFKQVENPPGPPARFLAALAASLPRGSATPDIWPRTAGLGSLGRPRWVARAEWNGGIVIREAKAVVPPAWMLAVSGPARVSRCLEVATGRHRSPDPWFSVVDGIVVRRLSPNNRKIEAAGEPPAEGKEAAPSKEVGLDVLLDDRMLDAMGRDLAAIHLGGGSLRRPIISHLEALQSNWLEKAAGKGVAQIMEDWGVWRDHQRKRSDGK